MPIDAECAEAQVDIMSAQNIIAEKLAEARGLVEALMRHEDASAFSLYMTALNATIAEFYHEQPPTICEVGVGHLLSLLNPEFKEGAARIKQLRHALRALPVLP